MKTFKSILVEAAYKNNLGFQEMVKFFQVANDKQIEKMEKILKDEDWEGFKKIIKEVLGTQLI